MRFKVQRTLLDNPTTRPYADAFWGRNPVQEDGQHLWYVEIPTLEELIAFTLQHGELVIGTDGTDHYIEIYDGNREREPE